MQEEVSNGSNIIMHCNKCDAHFFINEDQYYWDEKGYGYSTKLCKCPECKKIIIIKYYEDHGLDINKDTRWYK